MVTGPYLGPLTKNWVLIFDSVKEETFPSEKKIRNSLARTRRTESTKEEIFRYPSGEYSQILTWVGTIS